MNILYDHQAFSSFAYGGVSRIYFELMNAYSKDPEVQFTLSLQYSDNEYLKGATWNPGVRPYVKRISDRDEIVFPVHLARNFFVKRLNNHRKDVNRTYSEKMISAGAYDIFHPTYYDPYFLDVLPDKPFVLTVYDMIYELFPEYFPGSIKFLEGKSFLIAKAAKIITISESAKRDLLQLYHLPSDKIEVVYLANSLQPIPAVQKREIESLQIPERFVLYVGKRVLYKNFFFFVESIVPLLQRDPSLTLVCAGGQDFTSAEKKFFRTRGIENKLRYVPGNDAFLSSLYGRAAAFVFPSLYEGFGIPVLEAFACNCPVLISNTSSLPEIAGDACVQFDPRNKASIYNAVQRVLSSTTLQTELREKGRERVQLFSWERTANETKQIYKNIIQH